MPESIEDTNIEPESYVIIDDIRVLALKCGVNVKCLFKFFTMYSQHKNLNFFSVSEF